MISAMDIGYSSFLKELQPGSVSLLDNPFRDQQSLLFVATLLRDNKGNAVKTLVHIEQESLGELDFFFWKLPPKNDGTTIAWVLPEKIELRPNFATRISRKQRAEYGTPPSALFVDDEGTPFLKVYQHTQTIGLHFGWLNLNDLEIEGLDNSPRDEWLCFRRWSLVMRHAESDFTLWSVPEGVEA